MKSFSSLSLGLLLSLLFMSGCSSTPAKFHKQNPVYSSQGIRSNESVAYWRVPKQIYILNPSKIQEWVQINDLEYANEFLPWFSSEFDSQWNKVTKNSQKNIKIDLEQTLSERQALDSNIYIETFLPKQGFKFLDSSKTPRYIWIIHQVYLGPHLNKNNLFNIESRDVEDSFKEGAKTESIGPVLHLIFSATLWDNQNQQYLYHRVIENSAKINLPLEITSLQSLIDTGINHALSYEPWRKQ
jgi:hypothetical protein